MKRSLLVLVSALFSILLFESTIRAMDDDLERASQMNQEVVRLYKEAKYAEAVPVAEEVLSIREKALGPDHPDVAIILNNLATLYGSLGDYAKAEPLVKRSLALMEKAFGPDHPDVAISLSNLATHYKSTGDYARAEPFYKRSLAIREKAFGPDHPEVAASLNELAVLCNALGDYARAEPLYKRSLAIREKTFGPDHPQVAASLNELAALYYSSGDYARAEPLYKRSLAILERSLGPDHHDLALSLNNLALLYDSSGDYAKAEPLYKRSLAIREKTFGPDHPQVATGLSNLATLYDSLGDHDKSEPLHKRSLTIREKTFGPDHPDVAVSLNNLATLYKSSGHYAKAEPLLKRSLEILEKGLGPDHPDVATNLNNLASLYYSLGDYAKAEPLLKRSLATREKSLGPDHPDVASSLAHLALLHGFLGDHEKAEPLFKRSLAIRERVLGPDHPDVAEILYNLAATVYAARGEFGLAHALVVRSQKIDEQLIDQVLGFSSEDRQALFLATRETGMELALSLVAFHLKDVPSARKEALDIWLRRKGVMLESQKRFQEALVYSDDPKAVSTFQELGRIRSRLSQLTFAGPGKEGPDAFQRRVTELETSKRELEARLSSLSQAYALKKKLEKADSTRVAQALPVNSALVEFVRIKSFAFKAKGKEERWHPPHYLAFVLPAGKGEGVELLDLGDAGEIDRNVAMFKKALAQAGDARLRGPIESSRKIHDLVFEPLKKTLGGVKRLFISPDGNLNLIPFEVLQDPDGRFLIEDYTFNYLAAGRDVIGFGESKEEGGKALLIGDPDFDLGQEEKGASLRELTLSAPTLETPGRSSEMRGLSFKRLPGTREEVEGIRLLLGEENADVYTGKRALEEVLKQRRAPHIMHLATHGFFLKDADMSGMRDESLDRGLVVQSKPRRVENPLVRSGIVLAGANRTLKEGMTERADGIVTAEKILGLRLRGCEMVVLSACETGVGEVKSGEGVYGLRRAFTQAGAKSLVMSMWSVPDRETKELMVEFYKSLLSGKMDRCQALRQASLRQMQVAKERYGYPNPFYWGAFAFLGEP